MVVGILMQPLDLTVLVKRCESAAEIGVDALTVGRGRRRGVATEAMRLLRRRRKQGRRAGDDAAICIEANHGTSQSGFRTQVVAACEGNRCDTCECDECHVTRGEPSGVSRRLSNVATQPTPYGVRLAGVCAPRQHEYDF